MHIIIAMNERQECLDFINELVTITGLVPSALAKKSNVAPSTINRFLKPKEGQKPIGELALSTLNDLARSANFISYSDYMVQKYLNDNDNHSTSFTTTSETVYGKPEVESMSKQIAELTADAIELANQLIDEGDLRKEDLKRIAVQTAITANYLGHKSVTKNLILHLIELER